MTFLISNVIASPIYDVTCLSLKFSSIVPPYFVFENILV